MSSIPKYDSTEQIVEQTLLESRNKLVVYVEGKNDIKVFRQIFRLNVSILNCDEMDRESGIQEGKDYIINKIKEKEK